VTQNHPSSPQTPKNSDVFRRTLFADFARGAEKYGQNKTRIKPNKTNQTLFWKSFYWRFVFGFAKFL
jgi:hypothetical protein